MFYPNHQIRDYCLYLGSFEHENLKFDFGVYEKSDGRTSHAIVYGDEDSEYMSGEFDLENPEHNFKSWYCKINEELYRNHLNILKEK